MNDFKVGDKVRIIAAEDTERYKDGDILTVSDIPYEFDSPHVMVTCADGIQELAYLREIEPYAPDVITINRADLPEVTESGGSLCCGGSDYFTDPEFGAAKHRQWALQQLAVAEFIEARDKAAEEAIRKRGERRADLDCLSRTALIECIIELEASHD